MGHDGTSSDININKPIPDEFNINSETAFTMTFIWFKIDSKKHGMTQF